jgi:SulP family sulfate permease
MPVPKASPAWHLFVPKLYTVLREGYSGTVLQSDAVAGLTVAIVALPLAMALAIASGTTPEKGLITAIIAGFLISALGGSRFQIGGPTGAFVVVVFGVIARHGYDGLLVATLMAGVMLIVAGVAGLGTWIKYIPQPVVTGFTSGIAVIIASSQIGDLLGLRVGKVPADFIEKWQTYAAHLGSFTPAAVLVAGAALAIFLGLRHFAPRAPGFLIAVLGTSFAVWALNIDVATIGSRFGAIPNTLPLPRLPTVSFAHVRELLPSAFTIAFLAGVESLLCAVVADGMTGRRHKSNCELVAQGVANCASAFFGGVPATGAIARTATNIRAGARTPIAGMLHALFLLLFMVLLAPLARFIPLASLAAVLMVVAWNMSEIERFRHLMLAPLGDRVVLLLTFALTVLVDLTLAIEVGVVLAAVLFMHRMSEAVALQNHTPLIDEDVDDFDRDARSVYRGRGALPKDVEIFQLQGPFFFGVANTLSDVLARIGREPRVFVLGMRQVPMIDATGVGALRDFADHCLRRHILLVLAEAAPAIVETLHQMNLRAGARLLFAPTMEEALQLAVSAGAAPAPGTGAENATG